MKGISPMKNTVIPALGAIILAIACTVEVEELEDASRLEAEEDPSAPIEERLIAPSGRTMVPAEIQALANSLVPTEVRNEPHFVHFESIGATDEIARFRVSYGPLELGADELHMGASVAVTELEFDHHAGTATACHTGDCALDSRLADDDHDTTAWRPIDALTATPDVANVVTWVVRFYPNTNYGGTTYSLTHDVTNTGLVVLGVPNTAAVNGNDVWSSFRTYDATCAACLVNGKEVDIYDVTVYRDANFVGPVKNFGGIDSDSNLGNDVYSGGGSVDNSISSFKVSLALK